MSAKSVQKPVLWGDYFELLMEFEGVVLTNDPADPGGATKFGIDQRSNPGVDIASLTKGKAEMLYLKEWASSAAAKIPAPISFAYFDLAVNAGETQAARCLQRAASVPVVDGKAGPQTLSMVLAMISQGQAGKLLLRLTAERDLFYKRLAHSRPKLTRFLNGWLRRSRMMHNWAVARLDDKEAA